MKVFDFQDCREFGEAGEEKIKRWLESIDYVVERIGQSNGRWHSKAAAGEYLSSDFRVLSHRTSNSKELIGKTLEIKTQRRVEETGNFILEIVSNAESGREGWVYSTPSDYIAFYAPGNGKTIIVKTEALREGLNRLWNTYKKHPIRNVRFTSLAVAVPVEELEKIALWHGDVDKKVSEE